MILIKEIKISLNNRNRKFYQKLLNLNLEYENEIVVDINNLSKNSHAKVIVECDFCHKTKKTMTIQKYYHYGINDYACEKCAHIKRTRNNLQKYNVENVFQLKSVKNKIKKTNNILYNCDNPQQNREIHQRTIDTNNKIYGYDNPSKNKEVIQKIEDIHKERYGCWYIQTKECIEKKILNNNKKYGVDWTTQIQSVIDKGIKTAFQINEFESIKYQGSYELDFLKKCKELDILNKISNKISIVYYIDNIKHFYYPDFYFEEYNLIIEIKSSFTYKLHKEKCDAKTNKCRELNYNYIMIINKNYKEFYEFLKNKIKIS
jgi:hypothetical protein